MSENNDSDFNAVAGEVQTTPLSPTSDHILEKSQDCCFCHSMRNQSFYLFVNVLDLVYTTFLTMFVALIGMEIMQSTLMEYLRVALVTVNVLLFLVALAGFAVYLCKLKYTSDPHKVYSTVRLVICVIR